MKLIKSNFICYFFISTLFLATESYSNPCESKNDPFAPIGIMTKGPMKGKCLKIDQKRSFRVLSKEEAKTVLPESAINDSSKYIANFKHNDEFWIAVFPSSDKIVGFNYLLEPFPPTAIAAHGMLRMKFNENEGPTLYSQTNPLQKPIKIKDVVITSGPLTTVDSKPFNMVSTVKDEYALVHQIISLEEEVSDSVFRLNHKVSQYELNFSRSEIERFWELILIDFHDPEITTIYNLFKKSCVTPIFDAIDKLIKFKRDRQERIITSYPHFTVDSLRFRGLISKDSKKLPTLNEEFPINELKAACVRNYLHENP